MVDWQAILERDGPAVWRSAFRIVGNRADADECFQEAFLGALAVSRREPVENYRALLQRLAAARAVDRLRERMRRRAREEVADLDAVGGHDPSPSRQAEDAELSDRLREALGELPAKQAEVFCLHCLESWSYQEIARHLAVTVDAVGVLLYRARRRLRERMAGPLDMPHVAVPKRGIPEKEVS
jgi:RNA polymerase sigma-70 factor (ECF subfamily)